MDKIESMVAEISGVSKQREGSIASNELVGNVERSVVQSAHITEPWFWQHNQVKREALTMLYHTYCLRLQIYNKGMTFFVNELQELQP